MSGTNDEHEANADLDRFAYDDAAYVLGALSDSEQREFEAHLAGCDECRARVAEVQDVPGLLAGMTAADLADEAVPDTLLPGLLRRAGHRRRQQRWLVGGLTAVAAACIVALAVVLWPFGSSDGSGSAPRARDFVAIAATPVRADATLVAKTWGTQIELHCSYAEGVNRSFPYELKVFDHSGNSDILGSWTVPVGKDIDYQTGTRYSVAQISKIQIVTTQGVPVLELDN